VEFYCRVIVATSCGTQWLDLQTKLPQRSA